MAAIARVKGRLADEAVDTGLGSQPAVGILPNNVDSRTLDAGNFASRRFNHLGVEIVRFRPAEIHS